MATTNEELGWVLQARKGDPEAFEALVAPRCGALLRVAVTIVADCSEAEDILQEVLWRAFRGIGGLREPRSFDAWLRQLLRNAARARLREIVARLRREGVPAGTFDDMEALSLGGIPQPMDALLESERHLDLLARISALPERQRRVTALVCVAGIPAQEVARIVGAPVGAVYAALHRSRRSLLDPREATKGMSDTVLVRGYAGEVHETVDHLRRGRPDLRVATAPTSADAHVMDYEVNPTSVVAGMPTPPSLLLPLGGLADGRLDLEPFGRQILRWCWGDQPYWLPHWRSAEVLVYNAEMFARAGVPLPRADWTWSDFEATCQRLLANGTLPLAPVAGHELARMAEQLGATPDDPAPVREAAETLWRWRASGFISTLKADEWMMAPFYAGRAAMAFGPSTHPLWAFTQPEFTSFRWGITPVPRVRRSDPRITYWRHRCTSVRATAPDPVAAFAVIAAIVSEDRLVGARLPDYRTLERMRAWRALPLPLGKECLLELDRDADPMSSPPWLYWEAIEALAAGSVDLDAGMDAVRTNIAQRTADGLRGDGRSRACGIHHAPASEN